MGKMPVPRGEEGSGETTPARHGGARGRKNAGPRREIGGARLKTAALGTRHKALVLGTAPRGPSPLMPSS